MSLNGPQKPVNGLEKPHQGLPATGATGAASIDSLKKNEGPGVSSNLNKDAKDLKGATNGSANGEVAAGQPLEAAKTKEPIAPTKPLQPEAPLPKTESGGTGASTETKDNGMSAAQDAPGDKETKSVGKMNVDSSKNNLPANDPATIGNVPTKDSEGQDVDQAKAKMFAMRQESAKHGHDNEHAAVEEQPPVKKQRTGKAKDSTDPNTSEVPKRSMSKKKKEPKKAATADGQPRRSSRLAT